MVVRRSASITHCSDHLINITFRSHKSSKSEVDDVLRISYGTQIHKPSRFSYSSEKAALSAVGCVELSYTNSLHDSLLIHVLPQWRASKGSVVYQDWVS